MLQLHMYLCIGADSGRSYNGYDTMDESHKVETASPHRSFECPTHSG